MNANLYNEAIEYEQLTKDIYQAILVREGVNTVDVKHNVSVNGRSGVAHQIDVYWEFKQAGITHRVLVECKNYASNITLEKARNFFAVVHDIGNCVGIMVTKTGYQSGAAAFCKYYGLRLKLLRKPDANDWKGRIREVSITLNIISPVEPIRCDLDLRATSLEQHQRLIKALQVNPDFAQVTPSMSFLDKQGETITDTLCFWLPQQLDVLNTPDGGACEQKVELDEHYLSLNLGDGFELIQVIAVTVHCFVERLSSVIRVDANDIVNVILKDFESGDWEYTHAAG